MRALEGPLWLLTGEATAVACGGDSLLQDVAGSGAGETAGQAECQGGLCRVAVCPSQPALP